MAQMLYMQPLVAVASGSPVSLFFIIINRATLLAIMNSVRPSTKPLELKSVPTTIMVIRK